VKEWMASDKIFHIMRDHVYHGTAILGGMFGTRKILKIPSWKYLMDKVVQNGQSRDYDQTFLRDIIYPIIKEDTIVHASFHRWEIHAKNFSIDFDDEYRFVGEYVYADESRDYRFRDMIKNQLKK
jgi:hypothetical protein